jgi:hypothetical protein
VFGLRVKAEQATFRLFLSSIAVATFSIDIMSHHHHLHLFSNETSVKVKDGLGELWTGVQLSLTVLVEVSDSMDLPYVKTLTGAAILFIEMKDVRGLNCSASSCNDC